MINIVNSLKSTNSDVLYFNILNIVALICYIFILESGSSLRGQQLLLTFSEQCSAAVTHTYKKQEFCANKISEDE